MILKTMTIVRCQPAGLPVNLPIALPIYVPRYEYNEAPMLRPDPFVGQVLFLVWRWTGVCYEPVPWMGPGVAVSVRSLQCYYCH